MAHQFVLQPPPLAAPPQRPKSRPAASATAAWTSSAPSAACHARAQHLQGSLAAQAMAPQACPCSTEWPAQTRQHASRRRQRAVACRAQAARPVDTLAADRTPSAASGAQGAPAQVPVEQQPQRDGNSVAAKLELIDALQERSQAAVRQSELMAPPRMIDARMYAAAVQAQHKIKDKLEEAGLYADVLEDKVASYDKDLEAAQEVFKKVSMEFATTGRLAEAAVAAVKLGADRQDAVAKITKLRDRLLALEKAMKKEREVFSKNVPRKVPIVWVGSASEVKLVGDFDQWTRGVDLSNPEIEGDSVLRTFEGTLNLLPGKYCVKFLVDNEWRLAPEWPMEKDSKGETNNILEVK